MTTNNQPRYPHPSSDEWLRIAYAKLANRATITYKDSRRHFIDADITLEGGDNGLCLYATTGIPVALREWEYTNITCLMKDIVAALDTIITTTPALEWNTDSQYILRNLCGADNAHARLPMNSDSFTDKDARFINRDDAEKIHALLSWASNQADQFLATIPYTTAGWDEPIYNDAAQSLDYLTKAIEAHDKYAPATLHRLRQRAVPIFNATTDGDFITIDDFTCFDQEQEEERRQREQGSTQ